MASTKVHKERPEDYDADYINPDRNALPIDPQIDRIVNRYMYSLGSYLTNRKDRKRIPGAAVAENPTIISIHPINGQDMVSFVTQVENLSVEPDVPAKVVIDEIAGVIVMGENVRVSTVAIQQGNGFYASVTADTSLNATPGSMTRPACPSRAREMPNPWKNERPRVA